MVKFLDLRPIELADQLNSAYDRVINSGTYIGGMEVEAFEEAWAEYCGVKYCVGVGCGHDALNLACSYMAEKYKPIKPGITTPWKTCLPTWSAARKSCSPLPDTFTNQLTIAVHIYGQITLPDGYDKYSLVEDCAQAHGAKLNGIKAGKFGRVSAWSFYPSKNLGALGDAGAITTDDPNIALYAYEMRNYGNRDDIGINSRLDPLQAAFLRVKLPYLNEWNERRTENAWAYIENLQLPINQVPIPLDMDEPCWHIFAIEVDDRDGLRKYLLDNGVETMIHYPEVPYPSVWKIPEAEAWTKRTLSLPIAPHVTPNICKQIAGLINDWRANDSS